MANELITGPQTWWTRIRRSVDWIVVTVAIGIATLALINLNSAEGGDWSGPLVRDQLRFVAIGTILMFGAAAIDYRVYYRAAYPIYAIGFGFVLLVTIVGTTTNNATRWLDLAFVRFQPSELMKLVLVIGLARYLHWLARRESRRTLVGTLLLPGALVLVPAFLVIKQPDLSTGIILILIAMSVLAVTEFDLKTLLGLTAAGVISFMVAWSFFLHGYQTKRIDVWLDPESHPDEAYQIIQARTAVGNGGFFGRGVAQGTQNVLDFVPYKESDFSFAVFAEEWGFVGSTMLLALYMALVLWAVNLASQARDRFAACLCVGIGAMFLWHVVLNIGVVLEFFPNTGLPLPFFSHGGSNVVTMMLGLGVLMSVSRSRKWR
ncbi:rod shape-determining protein RodA [Pseudenhygromyxa sp. WMMC2535]|uniref:rod shape-determining protein RodA n=1 Tax=Pseudenhygromyxa sp. WMMC2535 TaxID=2712867 RepID=UPI0015554E51|nr:rod shape-determining protein RodA [Pseudenhygromyxa sp. WMMC2535]NVB36442.1 rod shape-determining protein RodA [Pseudenhygromyxa sp. WMMC2535]